MITEINDASSKLSKNSKADDPVSLLIEAQCNYLSLILIRCSCLRLCEYSTATWLSCNKSIKARRLCKPRWLPPKKLVRVLGHQPVLWGLSAMLLMGFIDRTWGGDDRDAYDHSEIHFQVTFRHR